MAISYQSLASVAIVNLLLLRLALDPTLHLLSEHIHHGVDSLGVLGHLHHLGGHSDHLWLHCHHGRPQNVDVGGIVHVIHQVVQLHLADSTVGQELRAVEWVEAHRSSLLHERLLLVHEVAWDVATSHCIGSHRKLLLDETALFLGPRVRLDIVLAHPVQELSWHLHQGFLRQHVRIRFEVVEGHKLDNVCSHVSAVALRVEGLIVTIESLHGLEVSITNTDDDDSDGE